MSAPIQTDLQVRQLNRLYDGLRTARLNERYYFTLQISMRRQEMIIDLILAVTAIGLVGLNAFSAPVLVTLLGLEIAVLAAAKPILNYSQRLMHATSLATRYGRIRQQFQELVADVNATHEMSESQWRIVEKTLDEMNSIAPLESAVPDRNVLLQMQKQVNEEFPPASLWYPNDGRTASSLEAQA